VPESDRDLADCVGAIYEAATGSGSWQHVGERLRRLMSASRVSLRIDGGGGPARNVLMALDECETVYAAYYHSIDPFSSRARYDFDEERTGHLGRTRIGGELVAEKEFLHSEFYVDFARRHERRHLLGGMMGVKAASPLGIFRPDGGRPFDARDARLLQDLLPHFQRALELRERLGDTERVTSLTRATLDGSPVGMAVVDAGLKLHFLNEAARRQLDHGTSALFSMRSGPYSGSGAYLAARSRQDAATLRRLVASATAGGAGGAMKAAGPAGLASAVLVSPAPHGLARDHGSGDAAGVAENFAVIVIQPLGRRTSPPAEVLCDIFGFSRAEAEVAVALSGGATAEDVASRRNVSLATVRSQIRAILGKAESENLRDFEATMASLAMLAGRDRPAETWSNAGSNAGPSSLVEPRSPVRVSTRGSGPPA
jgi:DNA-binding CsgD family transcriptional regulator